MLPRAGRVIQKFLERYQAEPGWDTRRTERADVIMAIVLRKIQGDILEIGAHRGNTTKVFCRMGAKYDRHVFVVDPWDGRQEGDDKIFQEFRNNTSEHANLTVHHVGSEDPAVRESFLTNETRFSFILVDGLHSKPAVQNDIEQYADLLNPGGIICFDDWRGPYGFCGAIREAVAEHLKGFAEVKTPDTFIEQYFVKLEE